MRRAAASVAFGIVGAALLVGMYLGIVSWAQGADHAAQLLWDDRYFVGAISAGFGTQIGLFAYIRALQRDMARGSVAVAGAGTATSSISMVACCAHHLTDVLPVAGLSGLAVFLVEFRAPLLVVGIAMNLVGVAVMLREVRRARGNFGVVIAEAAAGA